VANNCQGCAAVIEAAIVARKPIDMEPQKVHF